MHQQQPPPQWQPLPVGRRKQPNPRTPWLIGAGVVAFMVLSVIVYLVKGPEKPAASPTSSTAAATPTVTKTLALPSRPSSSSSAPPVGGDCPPGPDLLVWSIAPGAPASAQALGSYDSAECRRVHRESAAHLVQRTSPTGPGFCTQAAYASDNPGYEKRWLDGPDAATVVPPRLKHVIMTVGGSC